MKRWQSILIGVLISAVAIFLAFRKANFAEIGEALATARYGWVLLSIALTLVGMALRGLRWSVLLNGQISPVDGFWLFSIGFFFNDVLPARLGELARAYLAGRRPNMHFGSALSSVVVERLMDMVCVAGMAGIVLLLVDLPAFVRGAGLLMGLGAVSALVVLAIAARFPDQMLDFASGLLGRLPGLTADQVRAFLSPFIDGLKGVSDFRVFVLGLGISILAWAISGVQTWLVMFAFWDNVPLVDGFLATVGAGLGFSVPSAPSGLGPFHAAIIGVLTAVGYDADLSRTFAILLHAMSFVVTVAVGAIGLLREGVSFSDVAAGARSLQQGPDHATPAS